MSNDIEVINQAIKNLLSVHFRIRSLNSADHIGIFTVMFNDTYWTIACADVWVLSGRILRLTRYAPAEHIEFDIRDPDSLRVMMDLLYEWTIYPHDPGNLQKTLSASIQKAYPHQST